LKTLKASGTVNSKNTDLYTMMEQIPPDSPVWSLVDAFDAVTNGMDHSESFVRMEGVRDKGLLPWRTLIHGIRALYADDLEGCETALNALDDDSAPGSLKPLFKAWIARQQAGGRETIFDELSLTSDSVISLYRRLLIEPHPLSLLAEQAEEALRHGLEEQFAVMAGKVMKALRDQKRGDGPLLAMRYARYCLELLDKEGQRNQDFFAVVIKTLGEADGFCALGLALIGKDDGAASAALEKALAAKDGRFLDAPMASLITEFLPVLKSRGEKRPAIAVSKGQLELFGGTDG
jgi:hypothetical protein